MSNLREIIIQDIVDLLDGIVLTTYNTHPTVIRGMEHWNDTLNLPCVIVDEGETETVEDIGFCLKQATIDLVLIVRLRGDWTQANSIQEDIRIIMESTSNPYVSTTGLMSVMIQQDMETDLKEITFHYAVRYFYAIGAA